MSCTDLISILDTRMVIPLKATWVTSPKGEPYPNDIVRGVVWVGVHHHSNKGMFV